MKNLILFPLGFIVKRFIIALTVSFLIVWPLWNWEIMFSLLFYHSDNLWTYTRFHSHGELIQHYAVGFKLVWGPLLSAVVYTLVSIGKSKAPE